MFCVLALLNSEDTLLYRSLTVRSKDNGKKWGKGIVKVLVTQSCPTLCDPMDCSLPGSSVHGILWARILEWVAIPFTKRSS